MYDDFDNRWLYNLCLVLVDDCFFFFLGLDRGKLDFF